MMTAWSDYIMEDKKMREEINDKDLEVVAGGAVLLSEKRNRINS